jgi:arylsulfatase A-like enzyme
MRDNAYEGNVRRDQGYGNRDKVREWTGVYYALIEEIDDWVGKLLDVLDAAGATSNTMIIFTSDHGEMLGAHAMRGKVRTKLVVPSSEKKRNSSPFSR